MAEENETGSESTIDMDGAADELAAGILGDSFEQTDETEEGAETGKEAPRSGGVEGEVAGAAEQGDGKGTEPATSAPAPEGLAPDTWTKEGKAEWTKLPPAVRAEVLKREGDIAKYVEDSQVHVQVAGTLAQVLEPYQQMLKSYGVSPWAHIDTLLRAHYNLVFGPPEAKAALALAILHDAGIDPQKLGAPDPKVAVGRRNAEYDMMLRRMASLEQGMTGVAGQLNAQRASEMDAQVAAFAEDASHPHFYAVYKDIARLLDKGVCTTLEEAYDKAVWGNPAIRLQEQEKMAKERSAAQAKEQSRKLTDSRRAAAVNVRGQGTGSGAAAPAKGKWEDSLAGTLAEIKAKRAAS